MREMVEAGATLADIAHELGVDRATVRRRLLAFGLRTRRMARLDETPTAAERGETSVMLACARHGLTEFRVPTGDGARFRCVRCRSEDVANRRRRVKDILVAEAGGRCRLCGYDRYPGALQFHHVDPATQEFHLSLGGIPRSLDRARAEMRKCVLLCANRHAEVEAGMASVALE